YKSTDAVVRSSRHIEASNNGLEQRGTIDAALVEKVRATPGVKAAEAQQTGVAVVVAHNGTLLDANPNRTAPVALGWQEAPALNPLQIVSGHAPRAPDDVVIDRASFDKGKYALGEKVHVLSQVGSTEFRLVGVVTYGGANSAVGGAQVVAFVPQTAAKVLGTPGRVSAIQVVAQPGVSQQQLVTNLRTALHDPSTDVITGVAATDETRKATGASLMFINMFLMTFAIVALVVGSFVIYNTFSITVVQRTKETALLRAIGAKRKQVMRSVMLEALFTGVFASAAGVVAGIGTAQGLRWVLKAFSLELPSASTVVQSPTIIISMVTGIAVTLIAAYLPARKAGKVAPIEALRNTAVDNSAGSKRRIVFGSIFGVVGALMLAQGLSGAGIGAVGLGALGVFISVSMFGPVIARRFTRVLGWPLPRIRGMSGTLARENAMRNPRRTSSTASALMIGVALVALITVFAASAKSSLATSVDKAMKSNWIVDTQWGMGGLSPSVTQRIAQLPEVAAATPLRFTNPVVDGHSADVTAFDAADVNKTVRLDLRSGDVMHMGTHDVAVQTKVAEDKHIKIGDTVTMFFAETGKQRMHVVALYGTHEPLGSYLISMPAFDANVTPHVDNVVLVTSAPGVSVDGVRTAIHSVLKDFPNATLHTKQEFKGSIANQIDQILNLVYVLLAMALVIALFGIANTLALSVFERTREFGLLRAVGMSRSQVRSTVRWESVLIALLGTTLGTVIGLGFGWALIRAAHDQGINQMTIPVGQLALIVTFAAVAAVFAAALPARRAARLNVLEAISD
ncbi:MAG: ABC transporter permease, partial [Ilumatobacteraceae bacterium]